MAWSGRRAIPSGLGGGPKGKREGRRTREKIDKELQGERANIKKLQAKLEAAKAEVTKAEQEQDAAAYNALARDDKAAQQRLEAAENAAAKAARRGTSYQKAAAEATRRYYALESQWKHALNLEALEKLKALARKRIELSPKLDGILAELIAVNEQFNKLTRDMLAVKQSLGLDRLKLHEDNLRERLRVALYPTFGEFKIDKTFAVYREQKSMAEMEAICFEKLLEMEDVPEGGGQPQPNGQDDEIQAASTAAEAGAVA